MADVPRSISLSTNVGRSKHIYDGVFSAPTATKRHASTFSIHIDDYRDIFSSSDASLGSSIPIFDPPPVDGSDIIGRGRSSGIDYAGVFGGVGVLPAEMLSRESKKKAKADSHLSRSSMPTKIAASKGQEFSGYSGKIQALKSPTKTKTMVPEGQDFYSSSSTRDNPTPSQVSEGTRKAGTFVSKGQEFSSSSREKDNSVSIQAPQTPTRTRMTDSTSQESCGSSKDNGMSSNVSTDQQSDGIKQLNIPLQKMNQTVKYAAAVGVTQIAHLHAVPENIGISSNVPTDQQSDGIKQLNIPLQKMNQTVKDAAAVGVTQIAHLHPVPEIIGISSNVPTDQQSDAIKQLNPLQKINQTVKDAASGVTQIAHLHAMPGNIGSAEEVNPAGKTSLEKANHMSMDDTDVGINVGEGERQGKQIRSTSDLGKEKKYKDHDAHRAFGISKSNTFNATHSTREASCLNSPQLFGSSDYFRRSSSQRLKSSTESQHNDGSTSPLLELDMNSTAAASAAAVDRAIEEAEAKIRRAKEFLKGHDYDGSTKLSFKRSLKLKAASNTYRSEFEEEKLLKQKGHFDATVGSENVSSNKAGGLKLKDDLDFTTSESQLLDEVVSDQEDTAIKHASLDPLVEMEGSPEVVTLTEKSYKDDGAGEWEAAKQISQLISGVKNRFVSFISKQVDTEKTAVQDIPSSSEFLEQLFEGSTCHVEDADVHMKRENDQDDRYAEQQYEGSTFQVQDKVENDDEMIVDPSSGVEEIVHVSNICMNRSKPEEHITVALEVLTGQQCNLSELELDSEVVDSVDMAQETAYQSEVHVLGKEAICKDNSETPKDVQDQELVEKEVCSLRETEMPKGSEKKLEHSQKVQKTCTDEFQETAQTAELLIGVSEVEDDIIEHDKQNLEDCTNKLQEAVDAAEFLTKSTADVSKVSDGTSEDDEKKLDDGQVVEENCSDKEDNEAVEDAKGKSTIDATEATDDEKKLEDGVLVAELFMQEEDNETVEDANGKSTVDVTEVTDDEKKLEDAQLVEETKLQGGVQVAELPKWEDNEKTVTYELDEKKLQEGQIAEETCIDKLQGGDHEKIDTNEHDGNQFEDDQIAEETFTDKLQGGVHVVEMFTWEDREKFGTYEHDEKKLEDAQLVEETCTDKLQGGAQVAELFTWEDNKKIGTYEHDQKKLEGDQIAEETCTDKLQGGVQTSESSTWEDSEKLDTYEHDQIAEESSTDKLQGGINVVELFTREDNQTIDTSEDEKKNLEDAQIVEETCTDKLQGGVEASEFELFTREHMDVVSKITPTVTEVAEDSSDHPGKELEDLQIVEETFPAVDLLMREDSEISEYQDAEMESALGDTEVAEETFDHDTLLVLNSRSSQYAQHLESLNQGEERIEDPTISPSAPKMDIEQPVVCNINEGVCLDDESSQYAQHLRSHSGGEEMIEEVAYSTHHLKMNAENASDFYKNVMSSQSGSSSGGEVRIEEPIAGHVEPEMNVVREDICEQDVDAISKHGDYFPVVSHTCEQEQSSEMTNIESKTEGNIPQPSSVSTIHELIKEEMYDQIGRYTDVDNETLAHEDGCSPPADEKLDHEDECPLSADASRNEVHSSVTGDNEGYKHDEGDEHSQDIKFSCEDEKMAESVASISSESELRNEQPISVQTVNKLIREDICETDADFEQEYTCEEVFPVEINSETQGDEVGVKTDMGEVDIMHDVEPSYKRKQWSDDRVQGAEFQQSGIVLGDLGQENTQASVHDGVETKVDDEMVKEFENGKSATQTDACSSAEDVCHITKAYHRRRRWFEDREQEVCSTPIVSDVVLESESVNEIKNSRDAREMDVSSDQLESRGTAEAGRRRRRWFERREKLEPVQKPTILEDIVGATPNPEENTAKHVETSMESIKKSNHRDEVKREKEKKRERKAVQRAIREARERAFVDARERAAIAAQEKKEKVSSEPKSGSDNKAAMDAKLREERAAVERATSEARERAMQKAIFDKSASMSKETVFKNQAASSSSNPGYSSATFAAAKSSGVVSESPRRRRAISERHKRTMERAAKALEEKNMRDFLAQKEQDERIRLADSLDVDVKRWLTGKDGNLRAMLSTLQYILGPDSGWQPIPLTDLLTSTAVRKAYKRAALCVHPDKLQQRGATIQQKYICETVFDLLKDAWQKFNPDDW